MSPSVDSHDDASLAVCAPEHDIGPAVVQDPQLKWGLESLAAAGDRVSWLWQGILARGAVTLTTSQWKAGKSTLAALVLGKMRTGGEVAGLPVATGRAVVLSEEPERNWRLRGQKHGLLDHIGWYCRPFPSRPSLEAWCDLLDRVVEVHRQRDLSLVVIDPLAPFIPGNENDAGCMLDTLRPLERLTNRELAVWVLHHPRKGKLRAGQAARGSGALSGYADVLIEMGGAVPAAQDDRRRRLRAWSRFDETPRRLLMELNAEGTEYRAVEAGALSAVRHDELVAVLSSAPTKLPLPEILRLWPAGRAPEGKTLYRWLNRALAEGWVCRDGAGRRRDPYRYWLFGQEERWMREALATLA